MYSPRFARFRDSFVAKKLNSSCRDAHPPPPLSTISIHRTPPSFLNGAGRSVFRVSYSSIVRQFLHMPTAEVTHSSPTLPRHPLSSTPSFGRCRPPDRPLLLLTRLKGPQTANLSIERIGRLVISARSVAFHARARIKMQSRPPTSIPIQYYDRSSPSR